VLCIHLQALLNGDPHQEKIRGQLATLPVEALQAVRQLRMAGCSKEEKARIAALVRALETLVIRISQLVSRRQLIREIAEPRLRLHFEWLDVEFKQMLDAFRESFEQGDFRRPLPALQGALAGLDHAVQQVGGRTTSELGSAGVSAGQLLHWSCDKGRCISTRKTSSQRTVG
jgi:hypothetical protein